MKKVLITMSAFAVALMITLSSHALTMSPYSCQCGCEPVCCPACPVEPCCESCCPDSCCDPCPACPCEPQCASCAPKCDTCNTNIVNLEKACERTSWEVIKYSRKFSKFERIVKKADMENALECGHYIVFAPTNCALEGIKFDCKEAARAFVMDHLADANCYPKNLCAYSTVKTLCGNEYCIGQQGNMMRINNSIVVANNVQTQSGKIYGLDRKLK